MRREIVGLAMSAFLLAGGPAGAQSEPPIGYEWAEGVSPAEAGRRLLGPLATLYPNYGGQNHSGFGGGWGVAFASDPRSAGMEGMCEADVVWLSFVYRRGDSVEQRRGEGLPSGRDDDSLPVQSVLRSIRTETRYRAVSDTAPRPWTEEYETALDAACAGQTDGWNFRIADDGINAWYAARMQAILPDMARSQPEALLALIESCSGEGCETPLRLVEQLRWSRLGSTDMTPCDPLIDIYGGGPRFDGPYCLRANYVLSRSAGETELITVRVRIQMRYSTDQTMTLDPRLLGIRLQRQSIVED